MSHCWRIISGNPVVATPENDWGVPFDQVAAEWRSGSPTATTSGSTGLPATHRFSPDAVRASALATARHFGLTGTGIRTWSALPASGTGGRMAVWRALILGWDLTVSMPSSTPSLPASIGNGAPGGADPYHFGVATPMQARHLLESNQLSRFRQLLLGGAPLDPGLEKALQKAGQVRGCRLHMGFGMTETLTHIATRPIGTEAYRPLPGVAVDIQDDQSIVIDAPGRGVHHLHTRDAGAWISTPDAQEFQWLGRLDDVVNSGGIKVHPNEVERQIAGAIEARIRSRRWYVCGRKDERLGERVTLVIEGAGDGVLAEKLLADCMHLGNTRPRTVEFRAQFEQTETGKVRRM